MSWYDGSAGKFTVTTTETFDEMIVMIVHNSYRTVAAKFAYPARVGYTELTQSGNEYSAIMTETETRAARQGAYNVEVKLFLADNTRPVGVATLNILQDSEVGKIDAS